MLARLRTALPPGSRRRRGVLVVLALLLIGALTFAVLRWRAMHTSFAPGDPEQAPLAYENLKCAGSYLALLKSINPQSAHYAEQKPEYDRQFELHTRMGASFSEDKTTLEKTVLEHGQRFLDDAEKLPDAKAAATYIDARITWCYETLFRSQAFIMRTMEARKAQ